MPLVYSQEIFTKSGGLCFRIDDNQPANKINAFSEIFDSHKAKFCLAINPTFLYSNKDYVSIIKLLQGEGHEIMDHTPDHITSYFYVNNDVSALLSHEGIDHINYDKVCLSYDPNVKIDSYQNEGLLYINRNIVVSVGKGEFKDVDGFEKYAIYIPKLNKVFRISQVFNQNSSDVDTMIIKSFWDEDINLGIITTTNYELLNRTDVRMTAQALNLLFSRSRKLFESVGLSIPKIWVQPGAASPLVTKSELKNSFFKAGATVVGPSKLYFNERDSNGDNAFGMDWGQITPERHYFSQIINSIANEVAKHHLLIASGHFDGHYLNGWEGLLNRVDSILTWCDKKKISIRTYSQWAELLYYETSNPYENIFPRLDTDLNEDGIPDGYGLIDAKVDKSDGIPEGGYISLSVDKPGSFFRIDKLAGLEKGENNFEIYTKGKDSSKINVIFEFPEKDVTKTFIIPASTNNWTKYNLSNSQNSNHELIVPEGVSYCNVSATCISYSGGNIKISGLNLKKKSPIPILAPWGLSGAYDNGKVKLSWIDNSDNEKGFIIERQIDSLKEFKNIAFLPANTSSYLDTLNGYYTNVKYKVYAYNDTLNSESSNYNLTLPYLTDTASVRDALNRYYISINYPNPFNSSTIIVYYLPEDDNIQFKVFDLLGREVITFNKEFKKAGLYKQNISMSKMSSGTYIYQFTSDRIIKSGKMIYLK